MKRPRGTNSAWVPSSSTTWGDNVTKALGNGRGIAKPNHVRVLIADIDAPRPGWPEHLLASSPQRVDEFAADVLLTCGHHLAEDSGPFVFRNLFLPWVPRAREAKRRVVDGEIDIFGEPVYGMEISSTAMCRP